MLTALAALLRADRRRAVLAAWGAAGAGLLFTVAVAGTSVTPASGGQAVAAWAGPATLLTGVALLAAAAIGADGANARVAGIAFGWRQPVAALVVASAVLAPLGTAVWWAVTGADGPLRRTEAAQVPAFVAEEAGTTDRSRTLVLTGDAGASGVRYALVRGAGLTLGQAEGTVDAGSSGDLTTLVGRLLAGSGGEQAKSLAGYGVGYLEVKDPMIAKVEDVLDTTPGLTKLSQENGIALWQVSGAPATRAVITSPKGAPVSVPAGVHDIDTTIPAGPAGRVLRLAEQADPKWQATLDGTALESVTVDGWAQGFKLPADGGRLELTRDSSLLHTGWIWAQLLLATTVLVLALPGRRNHNDDDLPEEVVAAAALAAAAQAQAPLPGSRRARRMAERGEGEGAEPDTGVYAAGIPQQGAGEPEAEPAHPAADPYQEQYQQADPYGWDPYAAQQPAGGQYGQQQYAEPYPQQQYPDQYADQYEQQQYGYDQYAGYATPEQQPWAPGQPQPETYYDPNDPYGNGGHPHHNGTGS